MHAVHLHHDYIPEQAMYTRLDTERCVMRQQHHASIMHFLPSAKAFKYDVYYYRRSYRVQGEPPISPRQLQQVLRLELAPINGAFKRA